MHASPRFSRTKTNVSKHSTRDTRLQTLVRNLRVRQAPALERRRCTEHATTGRVHETKNNKNQNTRARAPVAPHSFKGNAIRHAHAGRCALTWHATPTNDTHRPKIHNKARRLPPPRLPPPPLSPRANARRDALHYCIRNNITLLLKNPRQIHSPPCSPTTGLFRKDTEDKISPRLHPSLFPSPTPAKLNVTDE